MADHTGTDDGNPRPGPRASAASDGLATQGGLATQAGHGFVPPVQAIQAEMDAPVVRPSAPRTFAQQKWVQNVLPWVTSGVLHIGIVVAIVLLYQAGSAVVQVIKEQIIIPDAANIDNQGPVGGVPNPGLGGDPNRPAAQDQVADSTDREVKTQRLNQAVASGTEGTSESVIGVGASGSFARGRGNAEGERAGGLFGVPGGGAGSGPPASFVGVKSNATRIVYLCDASGSMISVFPALQRQLRLSIDALKIPQSFGVIMFAENSRSLSSALLIANPDNKRRASDFIGQQGASDGTRPSAAIQQAFALGPQLIYVLTDGFEQGDPREIQELFRRLNREKKVKVNTILLKSTNDPELVKVLQAIASENGGTYKEVDKQDF